MGFLKGTDAEYPVSWIGGFIGGLDRGVRQDPRCRKHGNIHPCATCAREEIEEQRKRDQREAEHKAKEAKRESERKAREAKREAERKIGRQRREAELRQRGWWW